ncbi:MAG TPA: hypothetical protein VGY13_06900 [Solirubrobacteraceae bacterium]|jgi:hypothetical protein|nr:hypothetical protein [Solirubrobacteraceae bacterium]
MTTTTTRQRGLAAAARRIAVELTPDTIDQIAERVAQLLRHDQPRAPAAHATPLMTVKQLAHHLNLNPAWVYEHADQLGAIRTSNSPKARIRFDPNTATQALEQHQRHTPATPTRTRRAPQRPAPYTADAPLLEARDPYARGIRGYHRRACARARLGVG